MVYVMSAQIISEEGKDILYGVRKDFKQYRLVDPLDGSKEFISGNGGSEQTFMDEKLCE